MACAASATGFAGGDHVIMADCVVVLADTRIFQRVGLNHRCQEVVERCRAITTLRRGPGVAPYVRGHLIPMGGNPCSAICKATCFKGCSTLDAHHAHPCEDLATRGVALCVAVPTTS